MATRPTVRRISTPPNMTSGAATFAQDADIFLSELPGFGDDLNAVADFVDGRATAAAQSTTQAVNAVAQAQQAVTDAQAQAGIAQGHAQDADSAYQSVLDVAAAVGADVGLPALEGNAGTVLTVDENESGASWRQLPSNAMGNRTVSTNEPSGGSNGDIWYQVES